MANIAFKKGLLANLPSSYSAGTFYVTTDERAMYLDINDSTRIRLGDFQEFASLEALQANTNPSTSALYYISGLNILAKWDGSKYVQINKDTGATSFEVTGEGNAITGVSYDETTRKLTLTKGATYMKEADVDGKISTAVGALGNDKDGNAYANVKAYVDAKTEGIATDVALGALQQDVDAAEAKIEALEKANAEGGAVSEAIKEAKKAGTDAAVLAQEAKDLAGEKATLDEVKALDYATKTEAQGYADAKDEAIADAQSKADEAYELANGKATMEQVNAAIAGAGHAVKSEVDTAIENLGKAYVAADEALKTELQGNIDKKVDQTAYDTKVGELAAEDLRLAGLISGIDTDYKAADEAQIGRIATLESQITGLSGAMHFKGVVETNPVEITEGYVNGDVVIFGEKEYVWNGGEDGKFVEFGDVTAEGGRISVLENIVGKAAEGENAATGLVKAVADNAKDIADEKLRAETKEAELAQADADNLQAAKDYADGKIADLKIGDYVKKADADAAYAEKGHNHDDKYDAIGAAAGALAEAKSYADQAMADAKTDAANKDAVVLAEAQKGINANAAALALKADQTALDGAVERIGTAEGKITALETASATHALKTEVQDVQNALDEYKEANQGALDLKANAADVYAKTETYTKTEVDNAITAATTWGEF